MTNNQPATRENAEPRKVGAFDIRVVIAGLIGFYGIVLIIMGLAVDSAADRAKTGDVNANLWAGIGMAAVAAVFAISVRLRPLIIKSPAQPTEKAVATGP
ncbi:hypothetical protein ACIBQX_36895 [Nonomuraea sp. NPDC049714]|uniref:hypothetical protein n=1 Tax=Nonomuraea sp. NPDC049714 TaxID=3364357 RepID=UPI003795E9F4